MLLIFRINKKGQNRTINVEHLRWQKEQNERKSARFNLPMKSERMQLIRPLIHLWGEILKVINLSSYSSV